MNDEHEIFIRNVIAAKDYVGKAEEHATQLVENIEHALDLLRVAPRPEDDRNKQVVLARRVADLEFIRRAVRSGLLRGVAAQLSSIIKDETELQ